MAKMKIDMSNVKQFFFEKGEKVGLIGCTAIMVLVVAYALYSGMSSRGTDTGKEWDKAIIEASNSLQQRIRSATLSDSDKPGPVNIVDFQWRTVMSAYSYLSMFPMPDKAFTKKLNPYIMPIMTGEDEKLFQLNYYATGTYAYKIDPTARKATVIFGGVQPGFVPKGAAGQPQQTGGMGNLAKQVRPTRMVVVHAKFPMKEQVEEFRKALRYASLNELLAHRDELPKPIGLEVSRCEILPDGTPVKQANGTIWIPLFRFEKGVVKLAPAIKDMLRKMLVDDEQSHLAAHYVFPGLVTPLPKLAYGRYAKVDLKDFDIKEAGSADAAAEIGPMANPMVGGPKPGIGLAMPGFGAGGKKGSMPAGGMEQPGATAGQDIRLKDEPWKKLANEFQDKFMDKCNIFDPLGAATNGGDKKPATNVPPGTVGGSGPKGMQVGAPVGTATGAGGIFGWDFILGGGGGAIGGGFMGAFPPMGEKGGPRGESPRGEDMGMGDEGAKPTGTGLTTQIPDALVRFFDPSVEPGKTYRYTIRVRMANPNHGKKNDVAFQALADQKELDHMMLDKQNPAWVMTPAITIPGDFHWYVIDQTPEVKIKRGAEYWQKPLGQDVTPIQVHRWSDKVAGAAEWLTCDFAICERLYLRRGEPIGRQRVMIEMPTWEFTSQAWTIGHAAQAGKYRPTGTGKVDPIDAGIPVDLTTTPPALIVDYTGGRRPWFVRRDGTTDASVGEDTSAVEVLALTTDGRLVVRNSRIDSDSDTPEGLERRERYEQWRERLTNLRQGAGAPGGAQPPGAPPMGPKGGGERGG